MSLLYNYFQQYLRYFNIKTFNKWEIHTLVVTSTTFFQQNHKRQPLREEYIEFLRRFNISYNEKHILKEKEIT